MEIESCVLVDGILFKKGDIVNIYTDGFEHEKDYLNFELNDINDDGVFIVEDGYLIPVFWDYVKSIEHCK